MSNITPSKLETIKLCPASHKMQDKVARLSNFDDANDGALAHQVANAMFLGVDIPASATAEMIEGGLLWQQTLSDYQNVQTEREVVISLLSDDNGPVTGVIDAFSLFENNEGNFQLTVFEYKYGHRFVNRKNNWQLLAYTSGLMDMLADNIDVVEHVVVQPRCYAYEPVSKVVHSLDSIREGIDLIGKAVVEARSDNPKFVPSKACSICHAAHACSALGTSALNEVERFMGLGEFYTPSSNIAYEFSLLKQSYSIIKSRLASIQTDIISRLQSGTKVRGLALMVKQSRLNWSCSDAEVTSFGEILGLPLTKKEPITPTQAKVLAKKAHLPENVFDAITVRESVGVEVVADTSCDSNW